MFFVIVCLVHECIVPQNLIFADRESNICHNVAMERKKRLIIKFRVEDRFTGCNPDPIEFGEVDGEEAAVVKASPGFSCTFCEAARRCKKNFEIVFSALPSESTPFSDS
jgi:hypothetical protein